MFTATAMIDETANAKPIPTREIGMAIGAIDRCDTGTLDAQKSPTAINARPPPSRHRGSIRGVTYAITGSNTSVHT